MFVNSRKFRGAEDPHIKFRFCAFPSAAVVLLAGCELSLSVAGIHPEKRAWLDQSRPSLNSIPGIDVNSKGA